MASPAKRAKPSSPAKPPLPEAAEDPRLLLRRRWELASVLHFLRVFEPVIEADLGLSAEEIETALISPNRDLARIHIALLKGIPPANKNLKDGDVWIVATAKKLSDWWPWVAEGKNPLRTDPGKEVDTYKQQDPIKRLLILKALCELRSEQNDAVWYINDELKKGTNISNYRKEKLGDGKNGTIYWYDGDSIVGHRLYREEVRVDFKQNWKGKGGHLTKPVVNLHWETVATNLHEFIEISDKLCCKGQAEAVVGEILKTEIVPVLEELQKKKERALKRQKKKDELLATYINGFQTRALRERRPVCYSSSDYDRSIKEAIRVSMNAKEADLHKDAGMKDKGAPHQEEKSANGGSDISLEHNGYKEQHDTKCLDDSCTDDDKDGDYSDKDDSHSDSDEDQDAYDPHKSNLEGGGAVVTRKRTRASTHGLDSKITQGLRRSQRNAKICQDITHPGQVTQALTKKTLRQRPTPISKQFNSVAGSDGDLGLIVVDSDEEPDSS